MIPQTGMTRDIMENIDHHDTMAPIDIIRAINGTALDRLVETRDTNRGAEANTETTRAIDMTAHAHQVV